MLVPCACFNQASLTISSPPARGIYLVIGPLWTTSLLPSGAHSLMFFFTPFLSFTTTVLLTFFWRSVLNNASMRVLFFLDSPKAKTGAAVIVTTLGLLFILVCVVVLANVVAAGLYPTLLGLLILFTLAIAILFITTGSQVLKTIQSSRREQEQHTKKHRMIRIARLLIVSSFGMLVWCLSLVISAAGFFSASPAGWMSVFVLSMVGELLTSYTQIQAFSQSS